MQNIDDEEPHYLLDSNIISEFMKYRANFNVLQNFGMHISDCAICTIVWQELLFGLYLLDEGVKKTALAKFINEEVPSEFKMKHYTQKAAEIHADLRAKLSKIGKPTQLSDSMIAAIALANHMVLVTRNTKHFEAIQQVSELQIENWFEG